MNTGMTEENRAKMGDALAKLLADTYAVYLKTQNFHWNLTGPLFYPLHILFEKQYEELAEGTDEIAERIRALGFYVDASFTSFREITRIAEEEKVLSSKEMIEHLLEDHEAIIKEMRKLSALSEKENDPATGDMMGRRLNVHEKFAWMLRSQI